MRGKALNDRREKNRALAERDAANRCAICKRAFMASMKVYTRLGVTKLYCSPECLDEAGSR